MDKRHKRKEKSRRAILDALERLKSGTATHPRHAGIKVRITKEAVAREARVSPATLYRFPDLVQAVSAISSRSEVQRVGASEARRKALLKQIEVLEHRVNQLLSENLRLTRLLASYDPSLGKREPTDLETERRRRRAAVPAGSSS